MKMYLLKRTLSTYTSPDILLGCFKSLSAAQHARQKYLSQYEDDKNADPWKEQAIFTVDLEKDVVILDEIPVVEGSPNDTHVFVISSFAEGFGQIARNFHAICGTEDAARVESHKVRKSFSGNFPESCKIDHIVVGQLLSDEEVQYPF
jgi:hypothetical protein